MQTKIALASTSPRRRELLEAVGFELVLLNPNVDETAIPGESAQDLVSRLGREKALAVVDQTHLPIVAADTVVEVEGMILGKPQDINHAREMLELLSGKEHRVLTGFGIFYRGKLQTDTIVTRIQFRSLSAQEIENYLTTREWEGKSGACTLQGRSGPFVDKIQGSLTNVLGLPLKEVLDCLDRLVTPTGFEPVFTT